MMTKMTKTDLDSNLFLGSSGTLTNLPNINSFIMNVSHIPKTLTHYDTPSKFRQSILPGRITVGTYLQQELKPDVSSQLITVQLT
jgi:hypothetical protein